MRALTTLLLAAVLLAGCANNASPSLPRSVTLEANQAAVIDFQGGRYRFTWDASGCTGFFIRIVPKDGSPTIEVPVSSATGTIEIDVRPVNADLNRGGNCPSGNHTVTIERL